jgi:flagellum-specific ATP synthase
MTDTSPHTAANPHLETWRHMLGEARSAVDPRLPVRSYGRLTRAVGLVLEAVGLRLPVGSDCLIELPPGYAQKTCQHRPPVRGWVAHT